MSETSESIVNPLPWMDKVYSMWGSSKELANKKTLNDRKSVLYLKHADLTIIADQYGYTYGVIGLPITRVNRPASPFSNMQAAVTAIDDNMKKRNIGNH